MASATVRLALGFSEEFNAMGILFFTQRRICSPSRTGEDILLSSTPLPAGDPQHFQELREPTLTSPQVHRRACRLHLLGPLDRRPRDERDEDGPEQADEREGIEAPWHGELRADE